MFKKPLLLVLIQNLKVVIVWVRVGSHILKMVIKTRTPSYFAKITIIENKYKCLDSEWLNYL